MSTVALRALLDTLPDGATVPVGWLRAQLDTEPAASAPGADPARDLSVSDLAARFGRSASTVRGWIEGGRFPGAFKLNGRDWRVPPAAVDAFVETQRDTESTVQPRAERRRRHTTLGDWRKS